MNPSLLDPKFKYTNANDTAKPGYLQRRFDEIRKQLAKQQLPVPGSNVRTLKEGAK